MSMLFLGDQPSNPALYLAYGVRMHRAEFDEAKGGRSPIPA